MTDVDTLRDEGDTIPNFLKLDQIPTNYVQHVETDLLEPVVFTQGGATSDGFTRFTLQNKGFLHSHSKLFVALQPSDNNESFLRPKVGIGQIVKKAVLKIGNKTLNECDSWKSLYAVKSSLIGNEQQREREMYMNGRYMNFGFDYNQGSSVNSSGVVVDTGVSVFSLTTPGAVHEYSVPGWAMMDSDKPEECPSYMIDLADLFPFLKVHQLPLFMIDEPINIELTFEPTVQQRVCCDGGETENQPVDIVRDELKFCADYIFYGAGDEMIRFANANRDMSFSFVDYRVIEQTITHTELASGIVRNLGMANRIVPRVITLLVDDTSATDKTLLGDTCSVAPDVDQTTGAAEVVKYNLRYNDRFEYSTDIDNTAQLFSMTTHSEGVPFLTRAIYTNGVITGGIPAGATTTFQALQLDQELRGRLFNLSTKLTNGRVGQRGIELHLSGTWNNAGAFGIPSLLRSFCEYVRVARLSDGMFEVYNA